MRKKCVSILWAIVLCVVMSCPVYAAGQPIADGEAMSVVLDASDKITFAKQKKEEYETAVSNGEVKESNIEEIEELLRQAIFATGSEKEHINQQLEAYGVYEYGRSVLAQTRSGSGDVTISTPNVYYEAWEDTWTVTCGGTWKNDNCLYDDLFIGNVGGADGFGVGFTNTGGTYKSSVVRSSAYITDKDESKYVSTSYRSDGDGSKGFGFRLQDYVYGTNITGFGYVGYKWYGSCTYDSDFGVYNGIATAYYIHTWSSAQLTGVSFGAAGKTAGIEATIEASSNSFTGYSSDKTFGVY